MKNRDTQVEKKGSFLEGKRVCVCVTGSIAAVQSIKIVRELRRFGADVYVALTGEAAQFITPLSLEWASSHPILTESSGLAQHLFQFDMYVVAPATMNTINKFSLGIADNFVLSILASAWGRGEKIYFVPVMHEDLFNNPVFQENLTSLRARGGGVLVSDMESCNEGKFKIPSYETIVAQVCHFMNKRNSRVLLTAGPTRSYLDNVRYIQNASTGRLGSTLADYFYRSGIDVDVVYGPGTTTLSAWIQTYPVETADEMKAQVFKLMENNKYNAAIFAAAVLDFKPSVVISEKRHSSDAWDIHLVPTEKIIDQVHNRFVIALLIQGHFAFEKYVSIELGFSQALSTWHVLQFSSIHHGERCILDCSYETK
ncbi:MAG: bifunctional phosphopantothenoylcysteine decarboxylase/phosphopantothenate--cysteine ligase CoaBC [Deltaproteobacteria bacterium]|nr:bifunctional phosphopantothenoylcysteine decarboxylase/phosphopantothenate--cysteine ligase CoaBC [Deltaproteobacteria bacterium]